MVMVGLLEPVDTKLAAAAVAAGDAAVDEDTVSQCRCPLEDRGARVASSR
jgi:hypothetical protein